MIYRNQVMQPNHFSMNYLLNKQRKQKYKAHLYKIFEIQNRQFKPKQQAKIIDNKIKELTKLKQFARNFKTKQQSIQRFKNDTKMIQHIKQIKQLSIFKQQDSHLRKTKSTMKFNSRIIPPSTSTSKIKHALPSQQLKHQNIRLIKSISQNSFDEDKFRKTLKQSTKDYLKVRAHMRRVKGQRLSLKKLKTQPIQINYRAFPINLISTSNNQEIEQIQKQFGKISTTFDTDGTQLIQHTQLSKTNQTSKHQNKKFKKSVNKNRKMFTMNQSFTQIIDKKLKIVK